MPVVRLCPVAQEQQFDDNGKPLAGGRIFTYQGGSFSVLKTTYTTNAGNIANSNPIVLGSDGRLPNEIWLIDGETYNIVITKSDGTTVLQQFSNITGIGTGGSITGAVTQIIAGTNVTISPTGGTGAVTINATGATGGGTPGGPTGAVQFNDAGALGGTPNFLYDDATTTITIGDPLVGVMTLNGSTATIENASGDINLLPAVEGGYVVVGATGANGVIEGTTGGTLTVTSSEALILESQNAGVEISLVDGNKISVMGPTAGQYAAGLADNDLVNKYYVDTNGGGGGGGGGALTVSTKTTSYTTVLADAESVIMLDNPVASTTTFTIDNTVAYPTGTTLTFVNNSTQTLLVTCPGGNLIKAQSGLGGTSTLPQWAMATAIKLKANYWFINGAGLV